MSLVEGLGILGGVVSQKLVLKLLVVKLLKIILNVVVKHFLQVLKRGILNHGLSVSGDELFAVGHCSLREKCLKLFVRISLRIRSRW